MTIEQRAMDTLEFLSFLVARIDQHHAAALRRRRSPQGRVTIFAHAR